jgi:hypothetical protein
MALWSNTDANTSAPKGVSDSFAATGVSANGLTMYANTQISAFTTNQQVGMFGVDTTEQRLSATGTLSGHPMHAGWVLRKAGMGPVISITANTGAYGTNSFITFSGGGGAGNTAANATVTVNGSNAITSITVNSGGLYANTPVALPTSGNAVFTVVMGGRANRVMNETIVAMGSLSSDGSDDSIFPDS